MCLKKAEVHLLELTRWMAMSDSIKGLVVVVISIVLFLAFGLLSVFTLFGNEKDQKAATVIFATMSIEPSVFINARDIGVDVYKSHSIEVDISDLSAFYLSKLTVIDTEEVTKKRVKDLIVSSKGTPIEYDVGSYKELGLLFYSFLKDSFGHFSRIYITEEETEETIDEPIYGYVNGKLQVIGSKEKKIITTELVTNIVPDYGVKLFFPIPQGFMYAHFDDYGDSRTFGGDRMHIGNDLPGNRNTPIVAVEDGVVKKIGWNHLGGWIVEIDSGTRYYYLAHFEKYAEGLTVGSEVKGGQVIGYMGSSGYGVIGTNNVLGVHLHFQVRAQLEGASEPIWLNPYAFLKYIETNKAIIQWDPTNQNYMLMNGIGSK